MFEHVWSWAALQFLASQKSAIAAAEKKVIEEIEKRKQEHQDRVRVEKQEALDREARFCAKVCLCSICDHVTLIMWLASSEKGLCVTGHRNHSAHVSYFNRSVSSYFSGAKELEIQGIGLKLDRSVVFWIGHTFWLPVQSLFLIAGIFIL